MQSETQKGITVIVPTQTQIDALSSEEFRRECSSILAGETRAVIDLSAVQFIDSSGLGVILGLVREMHDRSGAVALCAPTPPVQALFRMVRLANIVEIHSDREVAVDSLQP